MKTKPKAAKWPKAGALSIERESVAVSRMSKITGIDRRTIDRICAGLPADDTGKIPFIPAIRAILAHFREDVEGKRDLLQMQRETERRRGMLLEIELKEKTGQLVPHHVGKRLFKELLEANRQWLQRQAPELQESYKEHLKRLDVEGIADRALSEP